MDDVMAECDRLKGDHATYKWVQEIFHQNMDKARVEGFRDCNSFDVVLYFSFEVFVAGYDFSFYIYIHIFVGLNFIFFISIKH